MLPFDVRDFKQPSSKGSQLMEGKFPDYMRRLCDFRQMDFEAAFDQLLTLVSLEPNQIYTSFYYRKQTKNQWARDDPAFVVIQAAFVAVGSLAFAIAFRHPSFWGYLWSIIYSLLFDWLLVGFTVTSVCSHLANKYMRQYHSHSVEQDVEWLYAFDVHANSFFCSFLLTYVVQVSTTYGNPTQYSRVHLCDVYWVLHLLQGSLYLYFLSTSTCVCIYVCVYACLLVHIVKSISVESFLPNLLQSG